MKKQPFFILIIFLLLGGDIYSSTLTNFSANSFLCNMFRIFTWTTMGFWYFDAQKHNFGKTQILFLLSILLPIISSFSTYLLAYKTSTFIYIAINTIMTVLWIYVLKKIGKPTIRRESYINIGIHVACFILFPLVFYFLTIYETINTSFKFLLMIFIVAFAYMSSIARFLDIDERNKKLLMISIVLLVLISIINSHHLFLQKKMWAYAVVRTLIVISRCLLIFVVIDISNKLLALHEED
jgi:hypothetical protein